MLLTIAGCSDAFGSGGRFHSSYLLETSKGRLLLDCGANSPLALKRGGIALSSIDAVVISHCHGDHFGGLPFLFLDKMFVERGSKPLEISGASGNCGAVRSAARLPLPNHQDPAPDVRADLWGAAARRGHGMEGSSYHGH